MAALGEEEPLGAAEVLEPEGTEAELEPLAAAEAAGAGAAEEKVVLVVPGAAPMMVK